MSTNTLSVQEWIKKSINQEQIDRYLNNGQDFINDELIQKQIENYFLIRMK